MALSLHGAVVERGRPDTDRMSTHLAHPPVTFGLGAFRPGTLEAVGFIPFGADRKDMVFPRAAPFVAERPFVEADPNAPKYRIAGSTASTSP